MLAMESPAVPPAHAQHAKQYVFVDEYNRHKRLKVMRACDGCRKRKIRCDGALQNGPWPCGACTRLQLKCVPPSLDQDNDSGPETPDSGTSNNSPFSFFSVNNVTPATYSRGTTSSPSQGSLQWSMSSVPTSAPSAASTHSTSTPATAVTPATSYQGDKAGIVDRPHGLQQPQRSQRLNSSTSFCEDVSPPPFLTIERFEQQATRQPPTLQRVETATSDSSVGDPEELHTAVTELNSRMGDLHVSSNSVAPYILNHHKHVFHAPAIDEVLLPASVLQDAAMHIPAEMMPHDDRAMDYFNYFFSYIHPYIPVLNKATFFNQWAMDRDAICPLILEAIFACTSQYLDQPIETKRWLALAAKHEEVYKHVPELATVQALIILMKAREFSQKPGYYYRSWMSLKYITTMAIDLGLHEHLQKHKENAISCKLNPSDCLLKTRIWQTLFLHELFIGGPQGRIDMLVEPETVELQCPFAAEALDPFEYQTTRRCAILAQCGINIKRSLSLMQAKAKSNPKDWALDPVYASYDATLVTYMKELPSDLQVHYPADGTAPWLGGDHYIAGMHLYYHLVVIQHHRPQLQAKLENKDSSFKEHLDICAQSAAMICRLHEALYRDFNLHGLLFMLRGINFTVYCVLTCTMLHLIAITSPDPTLNSQARDYFTRHMRILEYCISSASPEMEVQINALREAFSQDTSKAFELKSTLGAMRSPSAENQVTPPMSQRSTPDERAAIDIWPTLQQHALTGASSPIDELEAQFAPSSVPHITSHPVMAYVPDDFSNQSTSAPNSAAYGLDHMMHQSRTHVSVPDIGYPLQQVPSNELRTPVWDPSGIINQFQTAFGNPVAPPHASPSASSEDARMLQPNLISPTGQMTGGLSSMPMLNQNTILQQNLGNHPQSPVYGQNISPVAGNLMASTNGAPAVTSMMWQDAFTNAYISGHNKRHREDSYDGRIYGSTKRRG